MSLKRYDCSQSVPDTPAHWSREMSCFYNGVDEAVLETSLDQVLASLPATSSWTVDRADLYGGSKNP